jgi:hypothetical protein
VITPRDPKALEVRDLQPAPSEQAHAQSGTELGGMPEALLN